MPDALDLSDCLTGANYGDLLSAIAVYEKLMLGRAALLGKDALAGIKDFAAPTDESTLELVELFRRNGMAKD